jgi:hypothetical protein
VKRHAPTGVPSIRLHRAWRRTGPPVPGSILHPAKMIGSATL